MSLQRTATRLMTVKNYLETLRIELFEGGQRAIGFRLRTEMPVHNTHAQPTSGAGRNRWVIVIIRLTKRTKHKTTTKFGVTTQRPRREIKRNSGKLRREYSENFRLGARSRTAIHPTDQL